MTRNARLLKLLMERDGLTAHDLATALSVPRFVVGEALRGSYWFRPATERRLVQFLEVPKGEFAPLD